VVGRLDGFKVMAVLVSTATPFTYRVPVAPDSVTARCVHSFSASGPGASSRCSLPFPLMVIANRGVLVPPAETVRNM
jgi:hypothetical protein